MDQAFHKDSKGKRLPAFASTFDLFRLITISGFYGFIKELDIEQGLKKCSLPTVQFPKPSTATQLHRQKDINTET